jgi:hypothetical protein
MASAVNELQVDSLPSRFPVGTRYVIEGRNGRIHTQYLEFPDGRQIDLSAGRFRRRSASGPRRARAAVRKQMVRKF